MFGTFCSQKHTHTRKHEGRLATTQKHHSIPRGALIRGRLRGQDLKVKEVYSYVRYVRILDLRGTDPITDFPRGWYKSQFTQ